MKSFVALALFAVVFVGAVRKQGQDSAASAVSSSDDKALLVNIERSAWEAVKRKDRAGLQRLFGEGYFDFGSDGRYDPAKVLSTGWMNGDTLEDFSWTDLEVRILDDHTALVTYRGKYRGKESGKETSGEAYYSSLYQKQKGKWLLIFTQDSNLRCAGM